MAIGAYAGALLTQNGARALPAGSARRRRPAGGSGVRRPVGDCPCCGCAGVFPRHCNHRVRRKSLRFGILSNWSYTNGALGLVAHTRRRRGLWMIWVAARRGHCYALGPAWRGPRAPGYALEGDSARDEGGLPAAWASPSTRYKLGHVSWPAAAHRRIRPAGPWKRTSRTWSAPNGYGFSRARSTCSSTLVVGWRTRSSTGPVVGARPSLTVLPRGLRRAVARAAGPFARGRCGCFPERRHPAG